MKDSLVRLSARSYYGKHATGSVVLINGQPRHFTGKRCIAEANACIRKLLNKGEAK